MADSGGGARRRQKDQETAARMKAAGEERTTGICPVCYRTMTVDSRKTRYSHLCKAGRLPV
jgi:hypothetical protein